MHPTPHRALTRRWTLRSLLVILSVFISADAALAETTIETLRARALEMVNASRAENDLPPLKRDPALTQAAQAHADDMLKRDYYSHTSPEGGSVSDRFQAAGGSKWLLTAENIAKCEGCDPPLSLDHVRQMHEGWMDSPGHRRNILRRGLDRFGYGMAIDADGTLYAVQTFAGPGTPNGGDAQAEAEPIDPQEQLRIALETINEQRRAAGRKPLEKSTPLTLAALAMAPRPEAGEFTVKNSGDIYENLPDGEANNWSSLTLLTASCGGCGVAPVAADVRSFTKQWLEHADYAKMLLAEEATHLGFAMASNGQGKKVALGLIGARR